MRREPTQTAWPPDHDLIEVRLLGPLQVRRRDGSLVDDREWRTGKTADLLRLLALGDGQPVHVDTLLAELWPDVDETRGRASLRTAASQLRLVLGPEALDRRQGGLLLTGAWVDIAVYERLAVQAGRHFRSGEHAPGVRIAREAEALRLGDLTAHEAGARWAFQARATHQASRMRLLLSSSQAALTLGWLADSTDLAKSALEQDPASEQASRTLMRSYAQLGAGERALREFERFRLVLAEELGVDPSAQTKALQRELLTGSAPEPRRSAVYRRGPEADRLLALLANAGAGTAVQVLLTGDTAAARLRFVSNVCDTSGARMVSAPDVNAGLARLRKTWCRAAGDEAPNVVYVEGQPHEREVVRPLDLSGKVIVVRAASRRWDPISPSESIADDPTGVLPIADLHRIELHPLLREELHELAEQVLGDSPSAPLLAELAVVSGGSEAAAVAAIEDWLREGRVQSSGQGMVLLQDGAGADRTAARTLLARSIERLTALDLEVLSTLVVLDRPTSTEQLMPLLGLRDLAGSRSAAPGGLDLERSLGHLTDLGFLRPEQGRVAVRDGLLSDALRSWLRPSVLRRLHRAIAGRGLLTSAERIRHWLEAGEPELACAAALEAADAALDGSRLEDARTHLLQVCSLSDLQVDLSADGLDLTEQLAEVLRRLGRPDDAERVVQRAAIRPDGSLRQLPHAVLGTTVALPEQRPVFDDQRDGRPKSPPPFGLQERRGVRQVSHLPDCALPRLARVDGPAPELAGHLVNLLLGNAVHAEPGLQRLRADLRPETGSPLAACLDLLLGLAAHDLGCDGPSPRWREMTALAKQAGPDWGWVPVRVLTERHDRVAAGAAEADHMSGDCSELSSQLNLLARAALRAEKGDGLTAAAALSALVERGRAARCTLLFPEVAARLAMAEIPQNLDAALAHFDLFEWSVGAQDARPRAGALRLLARAAVRSARGSHARAAVAAAQAAQLAHASQLVPLAAQAHLEGARYLAASGSCEAVSAMALARDAFRVAGIEPPIIASPARRSDVRTPTHEVSPVR